MRGGEMKRLIWVLLISWAGFSQTTTAVMTDRAAARFLDQATWGPTPASIAALEQMGSPTGSTEQFAATPSDLPDQPILEADGKSNNNLAPVQAAFFQNAVSGPDQLAAARGVHALADLGGVAGVGAPGVRLSAVLADFPRQRVRQLPRHHQSRDPEPRHGHVSEHGE